MKLSFTCWNSLSNGVQYGSTGAVRGGMASLTNIRLVLGEMLKHFCRILFFKTPYYVVLVLNCDRYVLYGWPPQASSDLVWSLKLVLGWGTAWEYQVQYRVTVSNETQQVIYQSEDWLFEPWLLQPACQCTRVQDTEPTITLSCLLECDCVNFKQKALRCRNKCLCVWESI